MRGIVIVPLALAALLVVVAVGALLSSRSLPRSPEDAAAERVILMCGGGGGLSAGRIDLALGLARTFRDLRGTAQISSARVAAIIEKIRPDAVGAEIYSRYVDCLEQQAAIYLRDRGTRIEGGIAHGGEARVAAPAAEVNASTNGDCSPVISGSTIGNMDLDC